MKLENVSYAMNPGSHCDLFSAIMTLGGVEGLKLVILGTEECTYYGKRFILEQKKKNDSILLIPLKKNNIILGVSNEIELRLEEIIKIYLPKVLVVVTTCILEITGENIEKIIKEIGEKYQIKILLFRTKHFKNDNYVKGIEKAINEISRLIAKPRSKTLTKSYNLLGVRYPNAENSKLCKLLEDKNIMLNEIVPFSLKKLKDIEELSNVALNIVVDLTGIEMAKYMEKNLGVPYVELLEISDILKLKKEYEKLQKILNINLQKELLDEEIAIEKIEKKLREKNLNKNIAIFSNYISGIELGILLSKVGLIPKIIISKNIEEIDNKKVEILREKYLTRYIKSGNLSGAHNLYKELDIKYFLGMENPTYLLKNGIKHKTLNSINSGKFGFEIITSIYESFIKECENNE